MSERSRTRRRHDPEAAVRFLAPNSSAARLSRRALLAGFGVAGVSALSACMGQNKSLAASATPDGKLESKLNLYSWGDYDNPDVISAFKDDFDIVVQVDSYGSNEELVAKLATTRGTSGYDVVVPTGSYVPQMIQRHLIQELDHDLIPNYQTLDPNYINQDFDPGNKYSICKAWGTTGYVYDTTVVKRPMTSWQDFLDAAMNECSGATSLLEDPFEVSAIALASLGYSLNTEDAGELEDARHIIVDQLADHVRAYVGNAGTPMLSGTFSLLHAFNGDARQGLMEVDNPDDWKFVYPTPSANIWMDNWTIATGTQRPDAAHAFINYMISDEKALDQLDYVGYPGPNTGLAKRAATENLVFPELMFPAQKVLDRLEGSMINSATQVKVGIYTDASARSGA